MAIIQTTDGPIDESFLERRAGTDETDTERAEWVEYWYHGRLVHRSAHLRLKRWPEGMDAATSDAITSLTKGSDRG